LYAAGRPGYPLDALTSLLSLAGVPTGAVVADIGSGTGILTGQLLRLGYQVYAVEPNDTMRAVADRTHGTHPGYRSVAAAAEGTGLPDHSVDAITAGQSLHWFDPPRTRVEFSRILRPGGAVLALWNDLRSGCCAFCVGLHDALTDLLAAYRQAKEAEPDPVELVNAAVPTLAAVYVEYVQHQQHLTEAALWYRFLSASYAPPPADPLAERLRQILSGLFHDHAVAGWVTLHYTTTVIAALRSKPNGSRL
jgi:ubiquinone/menaquinone biosynthesis C-methylase UbiE